MVGFPAKYAGRCAACKHEFEPGTQIRYDEDEDIVHAFEDDCDNFGFRLSDMPPQEARNRMCGSCFLVHAGECY